MRPGAETLRLFVSVPIPDDVRSAISDVQAQLAAQAGRDPSVRWVRPEQFHITLRFLGDVPVASTDGLSRALRDALASFRPLMLRVRRVGFFPSQHRPRVVWVGVEDEPGSLERLHRAVDRAVASHAPEKEEQAFTGHLTLARLRNPPPGVIQTLTGHAEAMAASELGSWVADSVDLMRSELLPQGSRHTCLEKFGLTGDTTQPTTSTW